MNPMYVVFAQAVFRLEFEDEQFAKNFGTVFQAQAEAQRYDHVIAVTGNSGVGYRVCFAGAFVSCDVSRSRAAYDVSMIFRDDICSHTDGSVCVVHGAGVLLDGKMVSFIGPSDSGKTTLSLLFSKYGRFAGDEFAFLDIETGCVWQERHPYKLKAGHEKLLSKIDPADRMFAEWPPSGQAYYVSLSATNHQYIRREDHARAGTMVFPRFDPDCAGTVIRPLPAAALPSAILGSFMGNHAPSALFGRVLRMAGTFGVRLIETIFSDGEDAAEKLYQYLENMKTERKGAV